MMDWLPEEIKSKCLLLGIEIHSMDGATAYVVLRTHPLVHKDKDQYPKWQILRIGNTPVGRDFDSQRESWVKSPSPQEALDAFVHMNEFGYIWG